VLCLGLRERRCKGGLEGWAFADLGAEGERTRG